MIQAMEETEVPQEIREALTGAFQKSADWMRNR
jgi:truncated hemoglobin YjbI